MADDYARTRIVRDDSSVPVRDNGISYMVLRGGLRFTLPSHGEVEFQFADAVKVMEIVAKHRRVTDKKGTDMEAVLLTALIACRSELSSRDTDELGAPDEMVHAAIDAADEAIALAEGVE